MSKASRLIELYAGVYLNVKKIERNTACWRVEELTGMTWSDLEKVDLNKAQELFGDAQRKFDQVMSKKIGDAVTMEVRLGEWNKKRKKR